MIKSNKVALSNKITKLFLSVLFVSFIFAYTTSSSFASETKEFKGKVLATFLNDGAEFEIYWYVCKEKNINVTSFTDSTNESVFIVEGKHIIDFPVIRAKDDPEQVLVLCKNVTIILDEDINIISVENRGWMMFDYLEAKD